MAEKAAATFSVDARTILQLGRDSIKFPTTAVIELVKNGYDADATSVEVSIERNRIRIFDNGSGMDDATLRKSWLRIGFSEKRENKYSSKKRRKTGEKGIGRLSADRLGEHLTLTTRQAKGSTSELKIDWNKFDSDEVDLANVPLSLKEVSTHTFERGTEIIIDDLRQLWLDDDIERLYLELSSLVSPFAKVGDFNIKFRNYLKPEYNGVVQTVYDKAAELSISAEYDGTGHTISYTILDKSDPKLPLKVEKSIAISQLTQNGNNGHTALGCGPVMLNILFYPRSSPLLKEMGLNATKLRKFLDTNAGVKVYRDNISVKPFGYYKEPGGDWLNLAQRRERDPAGLKRQTYKVASYQIVGAVSVSRDDNPWLRDGAAREGLIENEAFNDLRDLTVSCVSMLEQHRHSKYIESIKDSEPQTSVERVESLSNDLVDLQGELAKLPKSSIPDNVEMRSRLERVTEKVEETYRHINDILDENRVLRGLATVGISTAVFGHETQSTISRLKSQVFSARNALVLKKPADVERAVLRLDEAAESASHVARWGQFALSRVRKDKRHRQKAGVDKIVTQIVNEIEDVFTNSNIQISRNIQPITAKVFPMDIESVLLNLLTNAYVFAGLSQNKKTRVELIEDEIGERPGFSIIVADSGPGVEDALKDVIWEPLVSTKKDASGFEVGTGLGLTIVSSTVKELGGHYKVETDSELGGARFIVTIPVVGK